MLFFFYFYISNFGSLTVSEIIGTPKERQIIYLMTYFDLNLLKFEDTLHLLTFLPILLDLG